MKDNSMGNSKMFGMLSLVMGTISAFIYFVSILLPISAIIFGIVSLYKKRNKLAIAGIVLGVLFTFQFVNKAYLLPHIMNKRADNRQQVMTKSRMVDLARKNLFDCDDSKCSKSVFDENDIVKEYTIDLESETIKVYFELYGENVHAAISAMYGYNSGTIISVLYDVDLAHLIQYDENVNTGLRSCSDGEISNCAFNISMATELLQYYNNMINN